LGWFQVRGEFDNGCSFDIDQHKLVDKVRMKVGEMGEGRGDFCKVANGDGAFDAQIIQFKKNTFSL